MHGSTQSIASEPVTNHISHQYGKHSLQTVIVWPLGARNPDDMRKYWVIYIHGGAWRDPLIDGMSFQPTISALINTSSHELAMSKIAGFASINYRLSPHPNFPQAPDSPTAQIRDARHPEHINDVAAAIDLIGSQYGIRDNLILVGHSCGSTLAFQYAIGNEILQEPHESTEGIEDMRQSPVAILGIAGIYDIQYMVDTHSTIHEYRDFIVGAFGESVTCWNRASPAKFLRFGQTWRDGKLVVLAHSKQDELIDEDQMQALKRTIDSKTNRLKVMTVDDIVGRHDAIWKEGTEVARLIAVTIRELETMSENDQIF